MPKIDTDLMRIIDLEFPRTAGMPEFPTHKPAYAFTLYHRHDDKLGSGGVRSSAFGQLHGTEHQHHTVEAGRALAAFVARKGRLVDAGALGERLLSHLAELEEHPESGALGCRLLLRRRVSNTLFQHARDCRRYEESTQVADCWLRSRRAA